MAASEVINDSLWLIQQTRSQKLSPSPVNYAVATVGAKQNPNLAMKYRHQFLFLCLFCCTFTFMIPFTTSKPFLFEGWFEVLPSLSPIYLSCHLATAYTTGIRLSALCHGYHYFLHLPKYLSRASPRWIHFLMCYRSLRGSLFLGKAMSSISSGLLKALRSLSRNLCHCCNFSCGLRFNSFVISLL